MNKLNKIKTSKIKSIKYKVLVQGERILVVRWLAGSQLADALQEGSLYELAH
jgi:hypothetical protein